jgi:rubrerythrin
VLSRIFDEVGPRSFREFDWGDRDLDSSFLWRCMGTTYGVLGVGTLFASLSAGPESGPEDETEHREEFNAMKPSLSLRCALFAGLVLAVVVGHAGPAPAATTLDNLQAAFNGESNAHARYLAFAKKADEEGFGQVASLFRAAARAEEIHANNHAVVIKKLGGTPQADLKAAEVKSTKENLQAAIAGESYERDTMYPEFLAQARKEGNKDALETFNFAKAAEAEHAKMYTDAVNTLDALKGSKATTYYVCTVCGFTTVKLDFQKCPVCFNPKDKYTTVS